MVYSPKYAKSYYNMGVNTTRELCGVCLDTVILEQQRKHQSSQQHQHQQHQQRHHYHYHYQRSDITKTTSCRSLSPRSAHSYNNNCNNSSRANSPINLADEYWSAAEAVVDAVFPCSALTKPTNDDTNGSFCSSTSNVNDYSYYYCGSGGKTRKTETTMTETSMTTKSVGRGVKSDCDIHIFHEPSHKNNGDLSPEQVAEAYNHNDPITASTSMAVLIAGKEEEDEDEDEKRSDEDLRSFSSGLEDFREQANRMLEGYSGQAEETKEPYTMILVASPERRNRSSSKNSLLDFTSSTVSVHSFDNKAHSKSKSNEVATSDAEGDDDAIEGKQSKEITTQEHFKFVKSSLTSQDDDYSTTPSLQELPSSLPPLKLLSKQRISEEQRVRKSSNDGNSEHEHEKEKENENVEDDDMTGPRPVRSESGSKTIVNGTDIEGQQQPLSPGNATTILTQTSSFLNHHLSNYNKSMTMITTTTSGDIDMDIGLNALSPKKKNRMIGADGTTDVSADSSLSSWPHPLLPRTSTNQLYVVREQLQWTKSQLDASQFELKVMRGISDVYQKQLETKAMECRLAEWRLLHEHEVERTIQQANMQKQYQQTQKQKQEQEEQRGNNTYKNSSKQGPSTEHIVVAIAAISIIVVCVAYVIVLGGNAPFAGWKEWARNAVNGSHELYLQQLSVFGITVTTLHEACTELHQRTLEYAMDLTLETSFWEKQVATLVQTNQIYLQFVAWTQQAIHQWNTFILIDGNDMAIDVHDTIIHTVLLLSRLPQSVENAALYAASATDRLTNNFLQSLQEALSTTATTLSGSS